MLLGRRECDGTHDSSTNAAIGTGSTNRRQLFEAEKRLSDSELASNPTARPFRLSLRPLYDRFAGFHLRHWAGENPRRCAAPGALFEPFPHEFEDGSPILRNQPYPRHFPHHGEIDAAKAEPRKENVDAI